jgi:Holliday junction resolvase RusA-like endonuclease
MVTFDVPGDPVPQPRPRIFRNGGVGENPKATAHKQATVAAARRVKATPTPGEVELSVVYFRATHRRVDLDNLLKLTQDALIGVCWADDSQIVSVHARKVTGCARPRTEVLVRPWPPVVAPVADWHSAWEQP